VKLKCAQHPAVIEKGNPHNPKVDVKYRTQEQKKEHIGPEEAEDPEYEKGVGR